MRHVTDELLTFSSRDSIEGQVLAADDLADNQSWLIEEEVRGTVEAPATLQADADLLNVIDPDILNFDLHDLNFDLRDLEDYK